MQVIMQATTTKFAQTGLCALLFVCAYPVLADSSDVIDDYNIDIVSNPSASALLFWTRVSTENGKFVVSGKVKRKNTQTYVSPGHIDIVIEDTTGQVLMEKTVAYLPTNIHKQLRQASRYSHTFDNIPPLGSVIKLSYDRNPVEPATVPEHEKTE
ncbi:MAG: hypothetical protein ACC707_03515 [Thiohalomonadales bacterium]